MPSVPDTSHLPWWLGPTESPSDALLKGVQAGSAIASNMLRAKQIAIEAEGNFRREETATKLKLMDLSQQGERDKNAVALKMMDLSLEGERNTISQEAQNMKKQAEIGKGQGILKMGSYMGETISNGLLLDPEREAGLWRLAAENPLVPRQVVDSMHGAFKEARDRKEKAEGISKESTALKQNSAYFQKLDLDVNNAIADEQQAYDLGDPEAVEKAKTARETAVRNKELAFRIAGVIDPEAGVKLKTATSPDGKTFNYIEGRRGEIQKILPHDESKILNPLKLARYRSQMKMLEKMVEEYSPSILGKDKKPSDEKIAELSNRYFDEALAGEPNKSGTAATAGTGAPSLRYDPATKQLVPIR